MWQKIKLYIISLWFLFLLLFINKIQFPVCFAKDCSFIGFTQLFLLNIVPSICLVFIVLGIIFYLNFNYAVVKSAPQLPRKITRIEDLNFENLSFLITYIIPLVCFDLDFDLDRNRNLLMLFLVLILIGWIFIKTNIFYTNPSLAVLGYHIYRIDTEESEGASHFVNTVIIVKGRLETGDFIHPRKIDKNIFFVTKHKNEPGRT